MTLEETEDGIPLLVYCSSEKEPPSATPEVEARSCVAVSDRSIAGTTRQRCWPWPKELLAAYRDLRAWRATNPLLHRLDPRPDPGRRSGGSADGVEARGVATCGGTLCDRSVCRLTAGNSACSTQSGGRREIAAFGRRRSGPMRSRVGERNAPAVRRTASDGERTLSSRRPKRRGLRLTRDSQVQWADRKIGRERERALLRRPFPPRFVPPFAGLDVRRRVPGAP